MELTAEQFSSVTEPLANIYAIPDHLHALCNMLGDGLVPSNAKAGYLAHACTKGPSHARRGSALMFPFGPCPASSRHQFGWPSEQTDRGRSAHHLGLGRGTLRRDVAKRYERHPNPTQIRSEGQRSHSRRAPVHHERFSRPRPTWPSHWLVTAGWDHVTLRTGFSAEMAERHARLAKEAASADAKAASSLDVASFRPHNRSTTMLCISHRSTHTSSLACPLMGRARGFNPCRGA